MFTGITHFTNLKYDFLEMIPFEELRYLAVVYLAGFVEILAAILIRFNVSSKYTEIFLILFLVAVLPANIYASLNNIPFAGSEPTNLFLRVAIQVTYILCLTFIIREEKNRASRNDPTK